MNHMNKRLFTVFLLLFTACIISGCCVDYFTGIRPQSHFDYPNSNVVPLGKVTGEFTKSALFSPVLVDGDMQENAIRNALNQKPDADILLDYSMITKMCSYFPGVHITTLRVEGTAAKMEIGKQPLGAGAGK